jgi:hypothetical protein
MSGIVNVRSDTNSGIVGRYRKGEIRQIKIGTNETHAASSSDIALTAFYFDKLTIQGNTIIISVTCNLEKRTSTAGNSGNIYVVGTDVNEVVCGNIGDGHDVTYTTLHASGATSVVPSNTNPSYKIYWGNSNGTSFEIQQSRLIMYEVWA